MKKISCLIFSLLIIESLSAQVITVNDLTQEIKNELNLLFKNGCCIYNTSNFIFFQEDDLLANDICIPNGDSLVLIKNEKDNIGIIHYTYQQYHCGILVDDAIFKIHVCPNNTITCNGIIVDNLSKSFCIDILRKKINCKIQQELPPNAKICLTRKNDDTDFSDTNFFLSYMIIDQSGNEMYFDFSSDIVIKIREMTFYSIRDSTISINTLYNGVQSIQTTHMSPSFLSPYYFYLNDRTRNNGITSYDVREFDLSYNSSILNESHIIKSKYISDFNNGLKRDAASSFWAMEKAYDYYRIKFGRFSYDNSFAPIVILPQSSFDESHWNSLYKIFVFGAGRDSATNALASLDAVGHEFTHAVISSTSELSSSSESKTLNESFSDIFGTMVEFFIEGDNGDYYIGEDFWISDGKLRDMMNPKSKRHPDTYRGQFWADTGDLIHINAGVQNKWFYLLAEGGEGINDNGQMYNVSGIGREKAAQIAYRNMVYYLGSASTFADAKNLSIFSAIDLFGIQSNEVLQTILAWDAVGVSSVSGINYYFDASPYCDLYTTLHDNGQPLSFKCIGDFYCNCAFSSNNTPVTIVSGRSIFLEDGFVSGDNFRASLISSVIPRITSSCFDSIASPMANSSVFGSDTILSTKEIDVEVFPNPSSSRITLQAQEQIIHVQFFNLNGILMFEESCFNQGKSVSFDIEKFPAGIYYVKVIMRNGKVGNTKIIRR